MWQGAGENFWGLMSQIDGKLIVKSPTLLQEVNSKELVSGLTNLKHIISVIPSGFHRALLVRSDPGIDCAVSVSVLRPDSSASNNIW